MKKLIKISLAIVLVIGSILLYSSIADAQIQIPENVRIGLYYESTAVTSFAASAVKGIQLGCFKDNAFTVLFEEPSANCITVRKDTYYVSNNNELKEYSPTSKTIPAGDRSGPFHVQIGENFNDLTLASQKVQELKTKGVVAYPAFVDGWQVWTGYYIDQNAAQADIGDNIQKKLGDGVYKVIEPSPSRIVSLNAAGEVVLLFGSQSGLFRILPKAENNPCVLKINNKNYRGCLEVRRFTGSDMTLIDILPLEQYLYGVVPSEIEADSNPEALKAQAVAARTYTLYNMGKHGKWDFDLCTTTGCQVYKSFGEEAASTNKAVDDTKGKKITYQGKLAEVFYFSSSGGKTEDVKNVWGSEVPYLKSVEDKYESGKSYHYTWETSLTAARVKEIMLGRGYDLGDIISMSVIKRTDAGRAVEFIVKGTKDQRKYTNHDCRDVFSFDSQWYTISTDADISLQGKDSTPLKAQLGDRKVVTAGGLKAISPANKNIVVLGAGNQKKLVPAIPTQYKFSGRGYGHAVGMSQEGAKGMANAGFKYDKILTYYFQGTKVE